MPRVELVFDISPGDLEIIQPVLHTAIDEDSLVGLRIKDMDGTPEHELARQVYVQVIGLGVEE